jgi:hypothetical protein
MSKSKYFIKEKTFESLIARCYARDNEIWSGEWYKAKDCYDYILIKHQDGSEFRIKHSFYRLGLVNQSKVFIVFSEHNGIFAFYKDDLEYFKIYNNWKIEIIFGED